MERKPPQLEEAIGLLSSRGAFRPESPGVRQNLGVALRDKGQLDEAIAEYRQAIRLKKITPMPTATSASPCIKGQLDEAITEYREAIRLKNDDAKATATSATP